MHLRTPVALLAAALLSLAVAGCGSTATPTAAPTETLRVVPTPTALTSTLPLEVDVAKAAAMRDAGALIVDVREPDEWASGHIEGATLIPLGSLAARSGELPRDRDIVVVCRTAHRSAIGRDTLLAAGFPSVTSMAGGMEAWIAEGRPVVTGE